MGRFFAGARVAMVLLSVVAGSSVRRMRLVPRLSAAAAASATAVTTPPPSRISKFRIRGRDFDVKRDDQWKLGGDLGAGISGNKVEGPRARTVVSIGGHQSNAMCAIAAVCRARGTNFAYLTKPVPRWLRQHPSGNYARALALGMELVPLHAQAYRQVLSNGAFRDELLRDVALSLEEVTKAPPEDEAAEDVEYEWVPQGGACPDAEPGVRLAAEELRAQYDAVTLAATTVVLPAGTGTTALFLARHLAGTGARVAAVPCATSGDELRRQMAVLDASSGSRGVFPEVLEALARPGEPRHKFGQPKDRDLQLWAELRESGLHVDLLYAPHTWDTMLRHLGLDAGAAVDDDGRGLFAADRHVVYLHCGGLEGVATQLTRYRHAKITIPDSL